MAPQANPTRRYLTPPEIARSYGTNACKIIGWIRRGELRAINVAETTDTRPKFRVKIEDLEAFEARRAAVAVTAPTPTINRIRRPKLGDIPRRY